MDASTKLQPSSATSKPVWQTNILIGGLWLAAATAIYKGFDNYTAHNLITASDRLTAAATFLIIGGWTGFLVGLVCSFFVGKRFIDQDFERFKPFDWALQKRVFLAGLLSSFSTFFTLLGNQFSDPSATVAMSTAGLAFTAVYDIMSGQSSWKILFWPIVATVLGSSLAAYTGSVTFTVVGIVCILLISNLFSAVSSILEQRGAQERDAVNLYVWRFFWLATFGTIFSFGFAAFRGTTGLLLESLQTATSAIPIIMISMCFVFAGALGYTLKKNNPVTVVNIMSAAQVLMSIPITVLGALTFPGAFGTISTDPAIWGVRLLGMVFLIAGVMYLRKTLAEAKTAKGASTNANDGVLGPLDEQRPA